MCNIARLVGISERSVYNIVNERRQQYVPEVTDHSEKENSYGVDFKFDLK